jgi:hypothetical protein
LAIVGNAEYDGLGSSVALSADAKTLVAGAPFANNYTGYVVVYRMADEGGTRTQLGQTIYGNATGDLFGRSVDIAANGMYIVLGSPGNYNYILGYVRVLSLDSSDGTGPCTWKQIGQNIIGEAFGDEFGWSVSISGDGKTIAVGAATNDGKNGQDSGHVRIYRLEDDYSSWEQIGEDLDGTLAGDHSGSSVSLSANGSIDAIGAPHANYYGVSNGQVKVYRIDSEGSSWEQLGKIIYGDNAHDWFGFSVDISPGGNTLAVGTYVSDGPGYVRVFSLEWDDEVGPASWSWMQIGHNITGEDGGDQFGWSVSLSDDANTLAIGAPFANGKDGDDTGHVRVYRMDDSESGWMQLGEDIDGEAFEDYSGVSVSLSADGKHVAIGSSGNGDNGGGSGHVRVFVME